MAQRDRPRNGSRRPANSRYTIEQDRAALARLIDEDADPAEISYYEAFSDPQARLIDRQRRSAEGQYRRRLRRRANRLRRDTN